MAENSGFFASVGGDRKYNMDFLARWVASFIGNGVYDGELAVTAGDGMAVTLPSGRAWINGYYYRNDGDLAIALDNADGVLNRKDTVVLRWDVNTRSITAQVLKGTPASSPTAPAIVRTVEQYDLKLAEISIPAGTTTITQALITDTRLDNAVCGIVTGVVKQVDTTVLYNQIQADLAQFKSGSEAGFASWSDAQKASFNTWLSGLKDALDGDTAGHLQNEIDAHKADKTNPHGVTASQIGALPHDPSVAADPDNTTDGWHYYSGHTEIPGNTIGDGEFVQISHDANYIIQIAFAHHQSGGAGSRVKDRGVWESWSPMLSGYKPAVWLSASATLTPAQSGSTICVYTAGITVTLPAPSTGAHYDFLVAQNFTLAASTGNIYGNETASAGTSTASLSAGHHCRILSDGSNWTIAFGNWVDVATYAKYAYGVPLASPGLRNQLAITKDTTIPTGLPDGTIVLRYTP